MELIRDIVCQVYAGDKSEKTIYAVLEEFIPHYEKLNPGYASHPEDSTYEFQTEAEMLNYFIQNLGLAQSFYWNTSQNNPDKIMVGVNITEDDKLIISLTIDGDKETEKKYFERLKDFLGSDIGVVTYVDPAEYNSGQDFVLRYQ